MAKYKTAVASTSARHSEGCEPAAEHAASSKMEAPEEETRVPVQGVGTTSDLTQAKAILRKNFRLKTRGFYKCCTITEMVLPVAFFCVMCLPKALVEQDAFNDEYFNSVPLTISSWGDGQCPQGIMLGYTPDTAEVRDVVAATFDHLLCDGYLRFRDQVDLDNVTEVRAALNTKCYLWRCGGLARSRA
eukprot:scaffold1535_cov382-Prasinococcus_capsulatus_cf.AAC.26